MTQAPFTAAILALALGLSSVAAPVAEAGTELRAHGARILLADGHGMRSQGRGLSSQRDGLRHRDRRYLPADCLYTVPTYRGPRHVFARVCLKRQIRNVDRLPRRCLREVYAFGKYRKVYGARCMRRMGWTVARRY